MTYKNHKQEPNGINAEGKKVSIQMLCQQEGLSRGVLQKRVRQG
jgi:hypothetical protein